MLRDSLDDAWKRPLPYSWNIDCRGASVHIDIREQSNDYVCSFSASVSYSEDLVLDICYGMSVVESAIKWNVMYRPNQAIS